MDERFDIHGDKHAAKVIEDFLQADKTVIGTAGWSCDIETEECRASWPVAVDGVPTGARLDVSAYPLGDYYEFSIMLNFPPCITRLDFVAPFEAHGNPVEDFVRWNPIVWGPHIHLWEDNKRFCTASTLPKELEVAIALPEGIKRFEQAMRHFCDIVNITIASRDIPALPDRRTFL